MRTEPLPSPSLRPLPVDELREKVEHELAQGRVLLLEAPPGAGKTTRLPRWLLDAPWAEGGEILVAQPRRIAARLAAQRVSYELGEEVGGVVGYAVRFEERSSPRTRLRFVTEGVLVQMLFAGLPATVAAVVLDEFHERHLDTDLAFALLRRLQEQRPELRVVVMSATLQADELRRALPAAPLLTSEGRTFPLAIRHLPQADDRPLSIQLRGAVHQLFQEGHRGILAFLPTVREIQRGAEALEQWAREAGFEVAMLHGELPLASQAAATGPARGPRVVLATNVAESSVTVPDVTAVVDSGWVNFAYDTPFSAAPRLELRRISRASATQRAGRAGRVAPGTALRLYTQGELAAQPERETPEILRQDLTGTLLRLRVNGWAPDELPWLQPPRADAWASATAQLSLLGFFDAQGQVNADGREAARLPTTPRLARLLLEFHRRGLPEDGCWAAALLSEQELLEDAGAPARIADSSDLGHRMGLLREWLYQRRAPERLGLRRSALAAVDRSAQAFRRFGLAAGAAPSEEQREQLLLRAILAAFPDRVGKRRSADSDEVLLASGLTARLARSSVVLHAPYLVAVDLEQRQVGRSTQPWIRSASTFEPDWLLEEHFHLLREERDLSFHTERRRIEVHERLLLGSLPLDETRGVARPSPEVAALLASTIALRWGSAPPDELATLRVRCRLLTESGLMEAPTMDDEWLRQHLREAADGCVAETELLAIPLPQFLEQLLPPEIRTALARHFPEKLRLPGGRTVTIHYESHRPPWIASRLQDFFGYGETPTLGAGRVPLTIELLAPNQRAVQVTQDLAGFWARHYPSIRKELMRRYPRHPWPEDGATAAPPAPRPPRRTES